MGITEPKLSPRQETSRAPRRLLSPASHRRFPETRLNLAAYGGRRAIEAFVICQEDCLARESAIYLPQRWASMLDRQRT